MGVLFGKFDIKDDDLKVIEAIVERVCVSIDGLSDAAQAIATAIKEKKIEVT